MLSALNSAAWWALAAMPAAVQSTPAPATHARGFGIEFPTVGVLTGSGEHSRLGSGFVFGGALWYELTPRWNMRVFGTWTETLLGRAFVSFDGDAARRREVTDADWISIETGAGVTYYWWDPGDRWGPYVGGEFAAGYGGYTYALDGDLKSLRAVVPDDAAPCDDIDCRLDGHDARVWFPRASILAGARMQLDSWLASVVGVSLGLAHLVQSEVRNTFAERHVRTRSDWIVDMRMTFTARVGWVP
jgi:hypothetical protein